MSMPHMEQMIYSPRRTFEILTKDTYKGISYRIINKGWYPEVELIFPEGHPLFGVSYTEIPTLCSIKGLLTFSGFWLRNKARWCIRWEHSQETELRGFELTQLQSTPELIQGKKAWTQLELYFEVIEVIDEIEERYGSTWMDKQEQEGEKEEVDGC